MKVEHWMLFGTFAEQRHFEYPEPGTYQGVIINANMAAHAPAGLAAFLLEKTAGMRYVVDPLTHAFQHDPEKICNEEGDPKPAIKSLAEFYGDPIAGHVGVRPILPKHFKDDARLKDFTEKCVAFQRDHLKSYMQGSEAAKYLDDDECSPPYAVIAPYFYLTETSYDEWLPVVGRAAEFASDVVGDDSKVFSSVVVDQGILESAEARTTVANGFLKQPVDGFIVWADNLDEQAASSLELRGLLDLAKRLRDGGSREVINLHGGYFSILSAGTLGKGEYFTGVTHGPEFGEFRGVVPVGGGIPIARYYVPRMHARMRYRDAQRIFKALGYLKDAGTFHDEVCSCDECRSVIDGDIKNFTLFGDGTVKSVRRKHGIVRIEYPKGETKLRCLRHYLQRKRLEYEASVSVEPKKLLQELVAGAELYGDVAGLEAVSHLKVWHGILKAL
ncbi:MAG: hypothetical protein L0Y44_06645 [Phycisphaerales bacterium]|nr:hypothetical protein [Phycisphaerales bacterium]